MNVQTCEQKKTQRVKKMNIHLIVVLATQIKNLTCTSFRNNNEQEKSK